MIRAYASAPIPATGSTLLLDQPNTYFFQIVHTQQKVAEEMFPLKS